MHPFHKRVLLALILMLISASPAAGSSGLLKDDKHCLALALYHEARMEGRDGMHAVASVVLNRVEHPAFPGHVCAVITEGGEAPPCQFSWWCDGRSDWPAEARAWQEARAVAEAALNASAPDPTGGALFFHSTAIVSPWHDKQTRTVQIGRHVFYR